MRCIYHFVPTCLRDDECILNVVYGVGFFSREIDMRNDNTTCFLSHADGFGHGCQIKQLNDLTFCLSFYLRTGRFGYCVHSPRVRQSLRHVATLVLFWKNGKRFVTLLLFLQIWARAKETVLNSAEFTRCNTGTKFQRERILKKPDC
jgi:hypothetical protein